MRYKEPVQISYAEFKRRVFNTALTECYTRIHAKCLGIYEANDVYGAYGASNERYLTEMAHDMAKVFFINEMNLDKATINDTKRALKNSGTFMQECVALCEAIADEKMTTASENNLKITDDVKEPELNEEEKDLIDHLFATKDPEIEADAVRDATVKALLSEREKANKIKEATSIAQQAGEQNKLQETINRISSRGPTSLMHAMITAVSEAAVNDVHSKNPSAKIGEILSENADEINTRAAMMYTLYESMNAFAIKQYTKQDLINISKEIYSGV